jgi:hypothetical protein
MSDFKSYKINYNQYGSKVTDYNNATDFNNLTGICTLDDFKNIDSISLNNIKKLHNDNIINWRNVANKCFDYSIPGINVRFLLNKKSRIATILKYNENNNTVNLKYKKREYKNIKFDDLKLTNTNIPSILSLKDDDDEFIPPEFIVIQTCTFNIKSKDECSILNGITTNNPDNNNLPCINKCGVSSGIKCRYYDCCNALVDNNNQTLYCKKCINNDTIKFTFAFNLFKIAKQFAAYVCLNNNNPIFPLINPISQIPYSSDEINQLDKLWKDAVINFTKKTEKFNNHNFDKIAEYSLYAGMAITFLMSGPIGIALESFLYSFSAFFYILNASQNIKWLFDHKGNINSDIILKKAGNEIYQVWYNVGFHIGNEIKALNNLILPTSKISLAKGIHSTFIWLDYYNNIKQNKQNKNYFNPVINNIICREMLSRETFIQFNKKNLGSVKAINSMKNRCSLNKFKNNVKKVQLINKFKK